MNFENLNILPFNNVLEDVNRIIVILAEEETGHIEYSINRTVQKMYNRHHREYMRANPDKRKVIQDKYREKHPKTDADRVKDREYAKAYYIKKKEENRIRNLIN